MKTFFKKLWKFLKFFLNWRFLVSFGVAWIITNGYVYIMIGIGMLIKNNALIGVGSSILGVYYLPFFIEKPITFAIAIFICKKLFPKDKKTSEDLQKMLDEEKQELKDKKQKRIEKRMLRQQARREKQDKKKGTMSNET